MMAAIGNGAIKIVHMDYPDIFICILSSNVKKIQISVGLALREFPISEWDLHKDYIERCFGKETTNKICKVKDAIIAGKECDRQLLQEVLK